MEHLLVWYFEAKLDHDEQLEVEKWLGQSEVNRKIYLDTVLIWVNAKTIVDNRTTDKLLEWEKFKKTLNAYGCKSEN